MACNFEVFEVFMIDLFFCIHGWLTIRTNKIYMYMCIKRYYNI